MEKIYRTPEKHLYPLHLVRPRFKNNLEDVLFYMAKEINDFNGPIDNESLNDIISKFLEIVIYQLKHYLIGELK